MTARSPDPGHAPPKSGHPRQGRPGPVSIHHVARSAGVGLATVSRVINDMPGVSADMRSYVRSVMDAMGYIPRPQELRRGPKRRTVSQDAGIIDLHISFPLNLGSFPSQAPIYSRVLDEVEGACERMGMGLFVRQGGIRLPDRTAQAVKGRIAFGNLDQQPLPPDFDASATVPLVALLGAPPPGFPGDIVQVDHARIGEQAARHLIDCGHRRVAFIAHAQSCPVSPLVVRGMWFRHWFHHLGGEATILTGEGLVPRTANPTAAVNAVACTVMDRLLATALDRHRVTALFLASSMFLPAAYDGLRRRGLVPHRDLRIITCDRDAIHFDRLDPVPDVIDLPCRQLAEQAVDAICCGRRCLDGHHTVLHLVAPPVVERNDP